MKRHELIITNLQDKLNIKTKNLSSSITEIKNEKD